MSAELVPYRSNTVDTLAEKDVLNSAVTLAAKIANTAMVPKALRGKPDEVLGILLYGREIGVGPMTALQQVHIVEGRPTASADLLWARAQQAGHELWVEHTDDRQCTVAGRRRGWPDERPDTRVTFTLADATRAGLSNKDNWKKNPRRMLQARAKSELAKLVAGDSMLATPFSAEEVADGLDGGSWAQPATSALVAAETPAEPRRRITRAKAAEPAEASQAPDLLGALGKSVDDARADRLRKRHRAICSEYGIPDSTRKNLIASIAGDGRASSNELDADELGRLCNELEAVGQELRATDNEPVDAEIVDDQLPLAGHD